jgi:dipeptidyl aminopeptidase/acylaminoacyl peptidase
MPATAGRRLRIAAALACTVVALPLALIAGRNYASERLNFVPAPLDQLVREPEKAGIEGLHEVSFRRADGTRLGGWFVNSRNRAGVVLLHGTNADRSSLVWEMRVLAAAGFGVLAYDSPGYGVSEGEVHWGMGEQGALGAALDWLGSQPDVDVNRMGALGFSMGGYILAQVAAKDGRLRAVVLAAAPSEIVEQTRWEHRRWGPLSELPAALALWWSGMPLNEASPERVVPSIAPRHAFFVGGSADPIVQELMTRRLYQAAREPKSLWIVEGAGHGNYQLVAPDEYRQRLVEFFSRELVD